MNFPFPEKIIDGIVCEALREDLGDGGDITTLATIPEDTSITAHLAARKGGSVAGTGFARSAFQLAGQTASVTIHLEDGETAAEGQTIMSIKGCARDILTAERVALNFASHMSGIATATKALVDAVAHTDAKITCTRKTLPGLRAVQKYAVRCGGGVNHRFGLYDAVMIKDNHIAAAGSIEQALKRARDYVGHMTKIEIEVDTLPQLEEALATRIADAVLLDNMSLRALQAAKTMAQGRVLLEASGNVTLGTIAAIADTGVDYISSGWLTHSAPILDLGLDVA